MNKIIEICPLILHLLAGIYIHIPFCKQKCNYCNFHFSTQTKYIDDFLTALHIEIAAQKAYLANQTIETLYFGGGTPSLLGIDQINSILESLEQHFHFDRQSLLECSFEVNPDDMEEQYLHELKNIGINRLSIGIQSFKEEDLKFMNRAHSLEQSFNAIQLAYKTGFQSLSVDLIYGTPNLSNEEWTNNILQAIQQNVSHLSAYALTVEPQTALAKAIKNKEIKALDESKAAEQFELLLQTLQENGYEQYEISNFSLPGKYAVHNTNYWRQKHYLGLGPSAHSFNGVSRQWNVANNALYIRHLLQDQQPYFELEILSETDRYNEYIMTGLRTQWGIDLQYIKTTFTAPLHANLETIMAEKITLQHALISNNHFLLTAKGKLYADKIASDFFH